MLTQAYFENIQPEIVKELQLAEHSIYAAVAWFTDSGLYEILCRKASRGLTVSVLLLNDEINSGDYGLDFKLLQDAGGKINLIGSREEMMHNKFCIIDGKTVITGSYNWTHKARTNDENITVTKDSPELAADFMTEFSRLYGKYIKNDSANVLDLQTLLKRLEIIKNTITLQDEEDIGYQTGKLKKMLPLTPPEHYEKIDSILHEIENKAYGKAMRQIEDLLQRYQSLITWVDPEIQGLQLEIRALSLQISSLEDELADMEQTIHRFEVRHAQELGDIILQILRIKKGIAQQKTEENPENAEAQKEFDETMEEERQYEGTFKEALKNPVQLLNEAEEKELKSTFRKISKLTHPDIVDKRFEKEAAELFIKAKQAKDNNDLQTLHEIQEYLETGKPFKMKFETITKNEELRAEARRLRNTVETLLHQISDVKDSEAYETITGIADWDAYFTGTKEKLQTELERLNTFENA